LFIIPLLTKKGLAQLLNIGDTGKTVDELLNAQYMSDFSDRELRDKFENPLVFQYSGKSKNINNAHGFDITVIVDIGKALIEAKEASALPSSRLRSAEVAQRLINASAKSGIKGVAYALAGYQPEVQEVICCFHHSSPSACCGVSGHGFPHKVNRRFSDIPA
jgi:hypothetical protein